MLVINKSSSTDIALIKNNCCSLLKACNRYKVIVLCCFCRIPEFTALWKDILYKPQSLCPQFTGLLLPCCRDLITSSALLN